MDRDERGRGDEWASRGEEPDRQSTRAGGGAGQDAGVGNCARDCAGGAGSDVRVDERPFREGSLHDRPWYNHYDPGVPRDATFADLTLPQFLERAAASYPDTTAVVFLNGRLTYRELKDQVDRLATALAGLGVAKDGRVAIQLPNLPQTVIAYYATVRLGAQAVFTNPLYTTQEMVHQWKDAGCTVAIVTDFTFDQKIKDHRSELPITAYVVAKIPEYLRFPLNLLAPIKLKRQKPHPAIATVSPGPGIYFFKDLIARTEPRPPPVSIGMDDIAVLQYTGGTTGVSKGAIL